MKISLSQSDLNAALQTVQRAVSSKSILPVLSGILVYAEDGHLNLCTTDLELSMKYSLESNDSNGEAVVLPARLVSDIVKNLSDGRVDIVVDEKTGNAKLTSGASAFDIKTYSAEDFPKFPELRSEKSITFDGAKFAAAVKQVVRAVSKDETRPVLCGILLTLEKGRLKMVATDSYRLSIHEAAVEGSSQEDIRVIVPARCMDEVAKAAVDRGADSRQVEMGLAQNQIYFKVGNMVVVSRLIEGNFPNYQQLLPENCELRVKIKKDDFASALRRVALLAQNNALVKIKIDPEKLEVSAITADIGSAVEHLRADVSGAGMEVAFNAQYLLDGLSSISEDEVLFELNSPLKPGILRPASAQDFIYLAMPVRIG